MPSAALALALAVWAAPSGLVADAVPYRLAPAARSVYQVLWQRPFTPVGILEFKPSEPGGATADSRTGTVVFGTRDGWIHAVRPDRSIAWEHRARAGFEGPPAIEDGVVYIGSEDGFLYALKLSDGKEIWSYDSKEELGTRPAVSGGVVYFASLQDTVFAVDAISGKWKWHHHREARHGFSIRGSADVVVDAGIVYGGFSDGTVAALDASTGRALWERVVSPPGEEVDVDGLALDNGRLYAAAYSGAVVALDPKTGVQVWSSKVIGAHKVTAAGSVVYAVGTEGVTALSSSDGGALWKAKIDGGTPRSAPLIAGRWLVVPAGDGGLRWYEAASGRMLRVFDPGTGISGPPAQFGSRMYVLSNGGDLYAVEVS